MGVIRGLREGPYLDPILTSKMAHFGVYLDPPDPRFSYDEWIWTPFGPRFGVPGPQNQRRQAEMDPDLGVGTPGLTQIWGLGTPD